MHVHNAGREVATVVLVYGVHMLCDHVSIILSQKLPIIRYIMQSKDCMQMGTSILLFYILYRGELLGLN